MRVDDAAFPAFYRVISNAHVRELSQLPRAERHRCIDLVSAVESALLARLEPAKINLASLGNMVPHLHWHVIARFEHDSHFPQPIWGRELRASPGGTMLAVPVAQLDTVVCEALLQATA